MSVAGLEGDAWEEVHARLARLELRVEELDVSASFLGGAPGLGGLQEFASAEVAYPDLDSWVGDYFTRVYARPLGGEWRWCPSWVEHPEAAVRLDALWRSWETLRSDPGLGMSTWLRDHLDPQLTVLLGNRGPFARCSPTRHEPPVSLPLGHAGTGSGVGQAHPALEGPALPA